jgi:hypothetical protein
MEFVAGTPGEGQGEGVRLWWITCNVNPPSSITPFVQLIAIIPDKWQSKLQMGPMGLARMWKGVGNTTVA